MLRNIKELLGLRSSDPSKPTETEKPIKDANTFDALAFYKNLDRFKQSTMNTRLGENNNAIQNLKASSHSISREDVKGQEDKPVRKTDYDILNLDDKTQLTSELVPNKHVSRIDVDNTRIYGGRFTSKGNLYYCSSQDIIGIFNSHDPYNIKKIKTVSALDVNWTIASMDTTEDEEYLVYSSISPYLHIVDLQTLCKFHHKITLTDNENNFHNYHDFFGVFNCKFSGDGKEIVCVTNSAHIMVYDLQKEVKVCNISGTHKADINAVCFANRNNSNIIFTGSDDFIIKAWDRRILEGNKPIGCFIGHREGITSIDSKGDERYLASNSKDQTLKLWDLRKMNEISDLDRIRGLSLMNGFDYRWMDYTYKIPENHRKDNSLCTFRGHAVLQTLIRCYFSPLETTGQRYLYSGSADGNVYVFDILTGENKTYISSGNGECIRDVSWHPNVPLMAATSFNGSVNCFSLDHSVKYKNRNRRQKCREVGYYGSGRQWESEDESQDDSDYHEPAKDEIDEEDDDDVNEDEQDDDELKYITSDLEGDQL